MSSRPTGEITREEHFFRNNLNIQFSWDDFQILRKMLPETLQWDELPLHQSVFHKFGQINNRKYVSKCGHFEAVYTKDNDLVTENYYDINMGTYNYYGPSQPYEHTPYDILPWIRYVGNIDRGYTVVL